MTDQELEAEKHRRHDLECEKAAMAYLKERNKRGNLRRAITTPSYYVRQGPYWCGDCHNTGELDCYCGGDMCVCENHGTYLCPTCKNWVADDFDEQDHDERDISGINQNFSI